ncbi:MAG: TIGR00730 family Rossman fold protein [Arenimonas sp.]|uniref:LOG family protein n=1 Tax=Arenimonas sp. TaxID=1872635 RepID=UPI003C00B918
MRICVYAASSAQVHPEFKSAAFAMGEEIALAGHSLVYGGGSTGLMGAVADGALKHGGEVIGILPKFMADLEWGHPGLTQLQLVEDMRERKHRLLTDSDAVIALPGGCGTLEELFEAITLKRLGIYFNPIVLLNTRNFYAPLQMFMDQVIDEKFMNPEHTAMWSLEETPADVLPRILATPKWREDARDYAVVR